MNLNRALLKYLLGAHIVINDLEDIDQSLASAMDWIINNDPSDLCCTFTYEYKDLFGEMITIELIKDGANLDIKENNKIKYVKLFCEMVMIKNVKPQMDAFTRGFRTILPKRYLNLFKPQDLQLMISGVPNIDVEEMIAHLLFDNHAYYNSEYHKFLVEILREYSADQLTLFLQFVTCKFSKCN